ncbi:uncharacterized protein LOC143232072 isoform X1 [Tachypleus tridentatus]|uniref:uncharacterized protein LOC143232072 isoform X1 n=1 Tax=Tachypleus tridentatus TaxID=6853 RepID=UPI003FCF63F1
MWWWYLRYLTNFKWTFALGILLILANSLQVYSNSQTSLDFKISANAFSTTKKVFDHFDRSDDSYKKANNSKELNKPTTRPLRTRRSVLQLANVLKCVTGCDPLTYKGYGCYCGYMGRGNPVDGIDKCCLEHDWCYTYSDCHQLLVYFVSYRFQCAAPGKAHCRGADYSVASGCATQLCKCDIAFAYCVSKYSCPLHRASCQSSSPSITITFHNVVKVTSTINGQ